MKKAFIWDMDGTLIDSYGVIVPSVCRTMAEFGIPCDVRRVSEFVIKYSVKALIEKTAAEYGFSAEKFHARCSEISAAGTIEIQPIDGAREALEELLEMGSDHFVITHRGRTTGAILEKLGLIGLFTEIITAESGFPRKPAPDSAAYLIAKYGLDPIETYYVGDRTIDIDFAINAGINGILFLPDGSFCLPNGSENATVRSLREIKRKIYG